MTQPTLFLNYSNINPLISVAYPDSRVLVYCTKDSSVEKVEELYPSYKVRGIWHFDPADFLDYDIVIVLDKDKVPSEYLVFVEYLEEACMSYIQKR